MTILKDPPERISRLIVNPASRFAMIIGMAASILRISPAMAQECLPGGSCAPDCIQAHYYYDDAQFMCVPVPDYTEMQRYLDAAPYGIGAECMWLLPGGTGSEVKVADIEYAWNLCHQDLDACWVGPDRLLPDWPFVQHHGNAVLGILGARTTVPPDPPWGTTGIAHGSTLYVITDCPDVGPCNNGEALAIAIQFLIVDPPGPEAPILEAGDVICAEIGPGALVELESVAFQAIRDAANAGVVVVEPANNESHNLDNTVLFPCVAPDYGPFCVDENGVRLHDSGAIIVGAGYPPDNPCGYPCTERSRWKEPVFGSTYGRRVDLQGYSASIVTTSGGGDDDSDLLNEPSLEYTACFAGTSGATPIVAGAAALLQSTYHAKTGLFLAPEVVRELLIDTGSAQQNHDPETEGCLQSIAVNEHIGPRPNVPAAISDALPCLDCDGNKVPDLCDIAADPSLDTNMNGVLDSCCAWDLNHDGMVNAADLALLLGAWGPNPGDPANLNCDGAVNATDLALLLGHWGLCCTRCIYSADAALIEALLQMGFANVDEYNEWSVAAPPEQAYTAAQELLELLGQ